MKIFISILIAIYMLWSAISLVFVENYPDEPKCFKITNNINFGILCFVSIGILISFLATAIYNVILENKGEINEISNK